MTTHWEAVRDARAIVFDVGGTLIGLDHPRIERIIRQVGVDLPEQWIDPAEGAARRAMDRAVGEGVPPEEQWKAFVDSFMEGAGVPSRLHETVHERLIEFHRRHHLWNRPIRGVPEALAGLARAGFRLAALSNSDGRAEEALTHLGLARDLEFVIDSHDVGVEKPDRRIFRMASDRLELAPIDCVYVGDILSIDVTGSRNAGMRAVLMDHYGSYGWADLPEGVPRAVEASELLAGFASAPMRGGEGES